MFKYFKYLFKEHLLQTIVLTAIPTIIYLVSVNLSYFNVSHGSDIATLPLTMPYVLTTSIVFAFILATLIIVLRFSKFKNQRYLDVYYSLPIKREKIILANIIYGIVQILIMFSIMYVLGLILFAFKTNGAYSLLPLIYVLLINSVYLIIYFLIFSFIFLKANSVIDGIAFISFWLLALLLLGSFVFSLVFNVGDKVLFLLPFYSLDKLNTFMYYKSAIRTIPKSFDFNIGLIILNFGIFFVISVIALFFTIKQAKYDKTENVGYVSNSIFGYKLLIPLLTTLTTVHVSDIHYSSSIIFLAVLVAISYVMYIIYRKSIKLSKFDYLFLVSSIVIGVVLSGIFK